MPKTRETFFYLSALNLISHMFESPDFPKSLDESIFESWLESGRSRRIPYAYLLVIWDELEANYFPIYAEERSEILEYERMGQSSGRQTLVAAYDLYSESRIA